MQLSKWISARTKTVTFRWLRRDWMRMSTEYRSIRAKCRTPLDTCFWCNHKFEDGEMMALASVEEESSNKLFCEWCLRDCVNFMVRDES